MWTDPRLGSCLRFVNPSVGLTNAHTSSSSRATATIRGGSSDFLKRRLPFSFFALRTFIDTLEMKLSHTS